MIKRTFILFLFSIVKVTLFAQILDPVKWEFEFEKVDDSTYNLFFEAKIEDGWSVYSQYLESDDGPIATSITFSELDQIELDGKAEEDPANKKEGYDQVFDMNVTKYHHSLKINQKVILKAPVNEIKGYVTFMTCDDTRCLPPQDVDFVFDLTGKSLNVIPESKKKVDDDILLSNELYLYGISSIEITDEVCGDESTSLNSEKSLLGIFILGILGGLIALVTPCVFPLIPLTVSFFTKGAGGKEGNRNAVLYGFFILLIYVLLSIPFHLLDSINSEILNEISTNQWLNLLFFAVFLIFALSFFGLFEITLPSSFTNRISAAEGVGGILGIFFMAFTLCLVSFSCTGPILGSLLAGALTSDGGAWQLTAGMAGFGISLAFPFALFALFPGWMQKLPKSGGWLGNVKIILGFLEVALALKFLSNADLVMHWGILKYELFMVLWILIAIGLALYLFGVLKFPGAYNRAGFKLPKWRIIFGAITIIFTAYLGFGLTINERTGNFRSLKLLSGLAPPAGYSWILPSDCPNGFDCFKDLQAGIAQAKSESKPILLDFTGYACVNCRKMEEQVWSDPSVFKLIDEKFVLISLYVDDKKELPIDQKLEVDNFSNGSRQLNSIGNKWAYFQAKYFNNNSQPHYVILDPYQTKTLTSPVGYTPKISEYLEFLNCGLNSFQHKSL